MVSDGGKAVLTAHDLRKSYRLGPTQRRRGEAPVMAVDGVSLALHRGECVAYLGRNGSGKSTTVKLLTGIISPDSGAVTICGEDPHRRRKAVAKHVGVVFGQRSQLWPDLAIRRSLETLRRLYRVPNEEFRETMSLFQEATNIDSYWDSRARTVSLGQRTLADIAAALVHRPQVLFLDEPTVGLDLGAKDAVYGILRRAKTQWGTTVMITSHDMQDVEALADRIIMLEQGKVIFTGSLRELKALLVPRATLVIEISDECPPCVINGLVGIETVEVPNSSRLEARPGNQLIALAFAPEQTTASSVIGEVSRRVDVKDMEIMDETLTQMMTRYYQGACA